MKHGNLKTILNSKKLVMCGFFIFIGFSNSACTSQAWYEGIKEDAKVNCRLNNPSESARCLDGLNAKNYDDYSKERSNLK